MSRDLRCFDDLDLFGKEVDDELEALEQDSIHRLIQMRGTNLDNLDSGEAVEQYLSGTDSPETAKHLFEEEIQKDERVGSCTIDVVRTDDGSNRGAGYELNIAITTSDDLLINTTLPVGG